MLTGNFLQRFLFKWKYAILICSIVSALAAAVSTKINRWLPEFALSYSNSTAQQFHTKISYAAVHYRFPNRIVLDQVSVLGYDGKKPMLRASKLTLGFSFPLFSSAIPLHYTIINGMAIDFPVLKDYLDRYDKKIRAWTKTLHRGDFRLIVPDGQIYPAGFTRASPISFKTVLDLKQNHVTARGFWGGNDKVNYELKGYTHHGGFDLDKLTLEDSKSSANLWGSWQDDRIDWKGFIFYDRIYILDIDGHLIIQPKDIILKQLSFSVDDDGVGVQGHCSRQNLFQCDADISYLRTAQHLNPLRPLKNISLHFHAQNTPQGLFFKGWSDLNFLYNPGSPASLRSIHLDFENLKTLIINGNYLKLKIQHVQSIFSFPNNRYSFPFEHLLASISFDRPFQKIITLSARLYAGHCRSRVFLDTSSLPWKINSQGSFNEIGIYHGLLSGTYDFQVSKKIDLSGAMALHNGNFNDTHFQVWAATALQMPSLARVTGTDISCRFKVDGKTKTLEDLKLRTDDIDLRGSYHVDEDDLVSSQGSIRFSKKLLSESAVGRHIIGLVRGAWTLPFVFNLSGNMYRMNFQWDKSPLKDKVRQHLFSFFERMIDQSMDAHPYYNVTMPNESVSPG